MTASTKQRRPRSVKVRSTFRWTGTGTKADGVDRFRRKTIRVQNSRQSKREGYVK